MSDCVVFWEKGSVRGYLNGESCNYEVIVYAEQSETAISLVDEHQNNSQLFEKNEETY